MVRTFLQVAAGAADIPVTRLLGQSLAGLSATGDSDTRNYYDMIAARQELDLRPQLERLDALLLRSAGVAAASLRFAFRPLWQLGAAEKAQVALSKAQTTQIYAGRPLWPAATLGALAQSQLLEDGTYPNAAAVFVREGGSEEAQRAVADYDPAQPRDPQGQWTKAGGGSRNDIPSSAVVATAPNLQPRAPSLGKEAKSGQPDPEAQALKMAVNLAMLPFGARRSALLLLQTVTNLFRKKAAESAGEPESSQPSNEPAEHAPSDLDPYSGQNIPFDRSNLENKIKEYLLNPKHGNNQGKARFYEGNLGFNSSNWTQLADQINFDKNQAIFDRERTGYGNSYYKQDMKVTGPNGRMMTLKGKFAITDGIARLITLIPD